ncbi:MAG: sugar phosphate isomerase/epimerase [Lentisphaeria bacterium]|nr:sugar phosphate isomerase/epimerase [Lentisphaeria bacterium]
MIPVTYSYPWTRSSELDRRAVLKNLADNGVRRLVLSSKIIEDLIIHPGQLFVYRKELAEYGLTLMDAHAPWGTWQDPGMPLEQYHEDIILREKMAIRICGEVGVTSLTFHTGNTFKSIFGPFTLDDYYAMLIRSMEELLPTAEKAGVVLCLENQWTPLNQSAYLLKAVKHFDSPLVGICYDSGHAHLCECGSADPGRSTVPYVWNDIGLPVVWETDMISKFRPWVVNCHFHDNHGFDDEHKLPGNGTIDWAHIMSVLADAPRLQCVQSEAKVPDSGLTVPQLRDAFRKISAGLLDV